jgi:hypothetical protein
VRKRVALSFLCGVPIVAPAGWFIGRAGWGTAAESAVGLGVIAIAGILSLLVFMWLEPDAGKLPPRHTQRLRT